MTKPTRRVGLRGSADPGTVASAAVRGGQDLHFAHLVEVLQREKGGAADRKRARQAPQVSGALVGTSAELLDEAEQCARTSRLNAAIELCQRLEPLLLQERDPRN